MRTYILAILVCNNAGKDRNILARIVEEFLFPFLLLLLLFLALSGSRCNRFHSVYSARDLFPPVPASSHFVFSFLFFLFRPSAVDVVFYCIERKEKNHLPPASTLLLLFLLLFLCIFKYLSTIPHVRLYVYRIVLDAPLFIRL